MNIYTGEILRMVRKTTDAGIYCYSVYGFPVFFENSGYSGEFENIGDTPMIEFIHALAAGRTVFVLLAYWVVENWKNEKNWQTNKQVSIRDVLGPETNFQEFLPSWYDDSFDADNGSFLFMIHDFKMLSDVITTFTSRGAAGFFICDTSSTPQDIARLLQQEAKTKADILKNVVDHTVFFISIEHDEPDLKVHCNKPCDNCFNHAIRKAEAVVIESDWYQQNKDHLVWDDGPNHCLIIKNPRYTPQRH